MKKLFRIVPALVVFCAAPLFVSCPNPNDTDLARDRKLYTKPSDGNGQYQFYTNYWEDEESYFWKELGTYNGGDFEIEVKKLGGSEKGGFGMIFGVTDTDPAVAGKIDCYRLVITTKGVWQLSRQEHDPDNAQADAQGYVRTYYESSANSGPISSDLKIDDDQKNNWNKIKVAYNNTDTDVTIRFNTGSTKTIRVPSISTPTSSRVGLITGVTDESFPNSPVDVRFNVISGVTP